MMITANTTDNNQNISPSSTTRDHPRHDFKCIRNVLGFNDISNYFQRILRKQLYNFITFCSHVPFDFELHK